MNLSDLPRTLEGQGSIGIDCETCDPELKTRGSGAHRGSYICGVAVATEAGFQTYLPVRHESGPNLPVKQAMDWVARQLSLDVPKVGARLIYDHEFLSCEETGAVEIKGPLYDIQVAEPLLDENRFQYGLDVLAKDYLGVGKFDDELDEWLKNKFGPKNPKNNIWRAPPEIVAPYAMADVRYPLQIFAKQQSKLREENLWGLFEMESKLVPMLSEMRQRGVRVDIPRAEAMVEEVTNRRTELIEEIRRQTGVEIPPSGMGGKIMDVMHEIGITEFPKTPTGKDSLTAAFIEAIDHPVAEMIVEVRKMDKLKGTFLEGSILNAHHEGVIHCNFNQLKTDGGGAVSGRFSSSKPNLQFIPVRTDMGKRIRSLFLPDEGKAWYKLDFSQIEYVLMIHDAVMGGLPQSCEIATKYAEDESADFHQLVAEMTGLNRSRAKTINFGLAYGEGVEKLCRQLGLSRDEGEALIRLYHARAPFMKPLIKACMNNAAKFGVILTLMGRKRRFNMWELSKWVGGVKLSEVTRYYQKGARRAFCHKALNARTQGSAADIMKMAMVDLYERRDVLSVLGVPQLTVHDELDGSVPKTREGYQSLCEVKQIMQNSIELSIPLRVDGEVGPDWGKAAKTFGDGDDRQTMKLDGSEQDYERFKYLVAA
jgi:DNA polymerase I-like protein with 3'-5' exonuclease and polymerase domains